jgi:tetratricopeptide (TPR) repeat protein
MVIKKIKEALEKRKQKKAEEVMEIDKIESLRETESMKQAEQIKKEADRLGHLKQYKTAIEEYKRALDIYPYRETDNLFKAPAEFLFKVYYNLAASHSFLNRLKDSIEYFDRALNIEAVDDSNKVKALMNKGNCYYKAKQLVKMGGEDAYRIDLESEFNVDKRTLDFFKRMDEKENLLALAYNCFAKSAELERLNPDAWYRKGHIEFLMGNVKDSMLSFDNVLSINKNYTNLEGIELFDDIKREKGVEIKNPNAFGGSLKFKTKTGHFVRSKAEKMIANFLFENNLIFQYNMAVSWANNDDFKATFFIPKLELYLEHFKYDYVKDYKRLMKWKIRQYKLNNKKLLYTTSENEKNIEEALKIKLKHYIVL